METSLASRVRYGLLALHKHMKDLADDIGVSKQVLSNVVNGHVQESKHHAAIAEALNCSENWLTTGSGAAPAWWNTAGTPPLSSITGARHVSDEDRIRRAELMVEALVAKLDRTAQQNATLRASLTAAEAEIRRLRKKLKSRRTP